MTCTGTTCNQGRAPCRDGCDKKLTQQHIREILNYNEETGIFTWVRKHSGVSHGKEAGSVDVYGYKRICIYQKDYKVHRLAWFYFYGQWPKNHIDHIDGNRSNNRISNLREATPLENQQNISKTSRNTSGYVGVTFERNKWRAAIRVNSKKISLGNYETAELAGEAYKNAKALLHTFHPFVRS